MSDLATAIMLGIVGVYSGIMDALGINTSTIYFPLINGALALVALLGWWLVRRGSASRTRIVLSRILLAIGLIIGIPLIFFYALSAYFALLISSYWF